MFECMCAYVCVFVLVLGAHVCVGSWCACVCACVCALVLRMCVCFQLPASLVT